jgi:hypothetical protein
MTLVVKVLTWAVLFIFFVGAFVYRYQILRHPELEKEIRWYCQFFGLPAFGLLVLALGCFHLFVGDWFSFYYLLACSLGFFASPVWFYYRGEMSS